MDGIIADKRVLYAISQRKLKINLCRNVNFVNGQNGSGKSAILASIQICLGANARYVNAYCSLLKFMHYLYIIIIF